MVRTPYTVLSVTREEKDKWDKLAVEKGYKDVMDMIRFYMRLIETGRIE